MAGRMKQAARNAITVARRHLERAIYCVRVNRLRELRGRAYSGQIPMDRYVIARIEFWAQYERWGDEQ
jgi:hypothetical protein